MVQKRHSWQLQKTASGAMAAAIHWSTSKELFYLPVSPAIREQLLQQAQHQPETSKHGK